MGPDGTRWDPMGPDGTRWEMWIDETGCNGITTDSELVAGVFEGTSSNKALAAAMAAASEVKAMESHGKPWKVMESHGKSFL